MLSLLLRYSRVILNLGTTAGENKIGDIGVQLRVASGYSLFVPITLVNSKILGQLRQQGTADNYDDDWQFKVVHS